MVLFAASFLTVLLAIAQLGNGANLDNVLAKSSHSHHAAGAQVENNHKTQTVTKVETTESENSGVIAGEHGAAHTSQHAVVASDSDVEPEVIINLNIFDSDDVHHGYKSGSILSHNVEQSHEDEWSSKFLDLGSREENLHTGDHDLFNQVFKIAESEYGVTSGRFGLLKEVIRATYIVVRNFGASLFGSNGIFEQTVRQAHRIVSRFWSAILGNPGLLTGLIRNTRSVLLQLATSVFGSSGLLSYAVDLTHRLEAERAKSVYGSYKHWPSVHFDQHSNGWLDEVHRPSKTVYDYVREPNNPEIVGISHENHHGSYLNSDGDYVNSYVEHHQSSDGGYLTSLEDHLNPQFRYLNSHEGNLNSHVGNLNFGGEHSNSYSDHHLTSHGNHENSQGNHQEHHQNSDGHFLTSLEDQLNPLLSYLNSHLGHLNLGGDHLNSHVDHHLTSHGNHQDSLGDLLIVNSENSDETSHDQNKNTWSENNKEHSASGSFSVNNKEHSLNGDSASSSLNHKETSSEDGVILID